MKWYSTKNFLPDEEYMPEEGYITPEFYVIYHHGDKGYKHQERDSVFMAKYCACSGWTEVVSNPEMDGQQRRYWDHFVKYDITHWSDLTEPAE